MIKEIKLVGEMLKNSKLLAEMKEQNDLLSMKVENMENALKAENMESAQKPQTANGSWRSDSEKHKAEREERYQERQQSMLRPQQEMRAFVAQTYDMRHDNSGTVLPL